MNLTIANVSNDVSGSDLQAAISAIGTQVAQHFQPEWNAAANLFSTTVTPDAITSKVAIQGNPDAVIYLGDSANDPTTGVSGALGYHSATQGNIPYGFIYLDICSEYGENWTVTLSHEVLELLGDPDAVMTVTGPAPKGAPGTVYYDLEVADPTQGDSYQIGGVSVSNFVGQAYFGMTGGSGNTNYLNLPLVPFGVRPGGYYQYEDSAGAHQIQGERVTDEMLAAKKRLGDMGRRNARRVALFNKRKGG